MSDLRRFAAELREDAQTARAMAEALDRRAAEMLFLAEAAEPDDAVAREAERRRIIGDVVLGGGALLSIGRRIAA